VSASTHVPLSSASTCRPRAPRSIRRLTRPDSVSTPTRRRSTVSATQIVPSCSTMLLGRRPIFDGKISAKEGAEAAYKAVQAIMDKPAT